MGIDRNRSQTSAYVQLRGWDRLMSTTGTVYDAVPRNMDIFQGSWSTDSINPIDLIDDPIAEGWDLGSPFDLRSIRYDFPVVGDRAGSPNIGFVRRYEGPVIANPSNTYTWVPGPTDAAGLSSADSLAYRIGLGATAISRCKPASPQASFAVFLAELVRDGVPSLLAKFDISSRLAFFRSQGSNYLNVEFGWKPFIGDLRKTAKALEEQTAILEDLRKNSGRSMRRQYEFPTEVTNTLIQENLYPWPYLTAYHWQQDGSSLLTTVSKRSWFAGEFRYFYPPVNAAMVERLKRYTRTILGADVSPETLWNAAPWTWLADWFGNVGDVLANVSAINEDNLTMRYGYLMQEATHRRTWTHHGVKTWYGTLPDTFSGSMTVSHKTRIGASPYGFGPTWDSFSPRQLAILAAIGITRNGGRAK